MSRDIEAAFRHIPWVRTFLDAPGTTTEVPYSRGAKVSTEDSLLAVTLNTPSTIPSVIAVYQRPAPGATHIDGVSMLALIGDGLNGHPKIIHGGITAMLIDEGMGIYLGVNQRAFQDTDHTLATPLNATSFTAVLKVQYLRPVYTPGAVLVTSTCLKHDGRKEWIRTEVRQWQDKDGKVDGHGKGELVVCASSEGLYVTPRGTPVPARKTKL